jgi:hypothetical protein
MSTGRRKKRAVPLTGNALRELIRVALEKGYYTESLHSANDHPERNISPDDIIHGLEWSDWELVKDPNWDDEHESYEYLIRTVDIEGEELTIKFAIYPEEKRVKVITAW